MRLPAHAFVVGVVLWLVAPALSQGPGPVASSRALDPAGSGSPALDGTGRRVRAFSAPAALDGARDGPALVALVRHAERAGSASADPGLTEFGRERARDLARLLQSAGITRIHSSDTRRTRETARPLADRMGIPIESYDPRELESFAGRLGSLPGRHLVVGHSNTTDELAVLLGGESHGSIAGAWEYDRLYLLTPLPDGEMETVLLRFGPRVNRP